MKLKNVVIVDGVRSPFSWGGRGMFEATRMDEVGAKVIKALMERNPKVKPGMIQDFGIGNVVGDMDLAFNKAISRMAGLPEELGCFSTNRECGSSMDTMQRIATSIMVGAIDTGIAFGIERLGRSLAMPPLEGTTRVTGWNPKMNEQAPHQRNMAADHSKYFSVPIPDGILDAPPNLPMPQTAQNVVDMYGLTREEMDEFTVRSHKKLAAAYAAGNYKDEVIPLEVEKPVFNEAKQWDENEKGEMVLFDQDECLRADCSVDGLGKLNPIRGLISFVGGEVRVTAGNSCPTNSGASAILLMSEEKALELGLEPLARIVGMGVGGVKGQIMGLGPIPASMNAMKHAGITSDQIDRVEFNEAFAAQVIPSLKELKISEDKVNVNGGSLGIGHPLGATGARLVMTVAKELRRSGGRYGLATQCIGSGQGISTIIEALH
ncbi:MAG: thiolase family protein [Deltaproteobacteria bacterium]|jgi:acetyl-CoA acetyltransferase family protein|nr:thiolase family protein [Deltaproteobacteria bacterium]MBT4640885.1 thiolase family protein [Deltaproteobacteria bacterium]MBT6498480.1 thiolase family protein [Deltaproteobacteria bacterium]MBT7155384.1 thiolase family protein [Deltaproteobacteria bacterium]MBT7715153.1 thiolase family protein [Deltaproteobacteria bacterium]